MSGALPLFGIILGCHHRFYLQMLTSQLYPHTQLPAVIMVLQMLALIICQLTLAWEEQIKFIALFQSLCTFQSRIKVATLLEEQWFAGKCWELGNWERSEGVQTKDIFLVNRENRGHVKWGSIKKCGNHWSFPVRGVAQLLDFVEFCNESPNPSQSTVVLLSVVPE